MMDGAYDAPYSRVRHTHRTIAMKAKSVSHSSCSSPELEALIADITEENRHEAVDFGPPQGREEVSVRMTHPTVGCAVRTDS